MYRMACTQFRLVHLMFGAIIIITIFFYSLLNGNTQTMAGLKLSYYSSSISNIINSPTSLPHNGAVNSSSFKDSHAGNSNNTSGLTIIPNKKEGLEETNTSYADVFISASAALLQQQPLPPQSSEEHHNIMRVESKRDKKVSSGSSSSTSFQSSLPNSKTNTSKQLISTKTKKSVKTFEIYEGGHILDSNSINNLCPNRGEALRLLILITSAPTHREQRLAIRQTWGHYGTRRDISIGFILGKTTNQPLEDQLSAENYMYSDLVRGHFIDSYNNLTLKTISLLEWVDVYCPNVTFVLKTDDDMFINVPKLLQFVEKHHNDKRTIYGRLAKKWKPIRNKKSKYYVSPEQYFPPIFPQFTTGPAYLLTSDIVHDLYQKSLNQTYLKLEDVYTTGIVAQLLNVKRVNINEFLNRRIAFNQCNIKKSISIHMIKGNEQFDLWKKLLDNNVKCK